jgi:hypothetical protein
MIIKSSNILCDQRKAKYIQNSVDIFREQIRVSERFHKTIVSASKIAVSMILCSGRSA